jgi:hypothetical protein
LDACWVSESGMMMMMMVVVVVAGTREFGDMVQFTES